MVEGVERQVDLGPRVELADVHDAFGLQKPHPWTIVTATRNERREQIGKQAFGLYTEWKSLHSECTCFSIILLFIMAHEVIIIKKKYAGRTIGIMHK
ncbi:hypothetical protein BJX76DRAFT_323665 [Aspergillus varians]